MKGARERNAARTRHFERANPTLSAGGIRPGAEPVSQCVGLTDLPCG